MAKMTSAEAAKLLKNLNAEHFMLLKREESSRSFLAALGEDVESARPAYDYAETQAELARLESKICKVKHALNVFNTVTVIPGFDITIDEMLVLLPQLSSRAAKLEMMQAVLPKQRENSGYSHSNVVDYRYANYDIEQAARDYAEASDLLARAQTALDLVNSTVQFEVPD